jgi:uncharacterized RmlC-like cupin family protein
MSGTRHQASGIGVALGLAVIALASATVQDLPHAFPRDGARQVLDNPWATAWDATWATHVQTPVHRHAFDYVGVELVDSTFNVTPPGGNPRQTSRKKGDAYFLPQGTTHSEEGLSDQPPRHAVLIDLKPQHSPTVANNTRYRTMFPEGVAKRVVDNARVLIWDMTWTAGQPAQAYFYTHNTFIVYVDGGELRSSEAGGVEALRQIAAGQVTFVAAGRSRSDQATSAPIRAILVELK